MQTRMMIEVYEREFLFQFIYNKFKFWMQSFICNMIMKKGFSFTMLLIAIIMVVVSGLVLVDFIWIIGYW